MKNYDDLTNRLLERRNRYVATQQKKRKMMLRASASVGCVAVVALAGVGLVRSGVFDQTPPVTNVVVKTTATVTTAPTEQDVTTTTTTVDTPTTETTTTATVDTPTTETTMTPTQTTITTVAPTTGKTEPTQATTTTTKPTTICPTTSQMAPTTSQTVPTSSQTTATQTTATTQTTVTQPSNEDPGEPLPPWPYLWIIYDMNANYANGEVPIYFKLEGFEEVPFDWVKETSYTAYGFSVVGDITVERDAETGAIIYRMVLAYDGVVRDPSFFFSVVTADGRKQTDGLYGYPAPHGFFASCSYDSAYSSSVYYLVETGVITHDEYQAIMEKYWRESVNGSMSWS